MRQIRQISLSLCLVALLLLVGCETERQAVDTEINSEGGSKLTEQHSDTGKIFDQGTETPSHAENPSMQGGNPQLQVQSDTDEDPYIVYERIMLEEHDDQWIPLADCGRILQIPEEITPKEYFAGIQEQAKAQAIVYMQKYLQWAENFQQIYGGTSASNTYYVDQRIDSLVPEGVFSRDGTLYLVYTLDFSLLPVQATSLLLAGGMAIDGDGWGDPGLSTVLALTIEDDELSLYFGEPSDILPDNAEFFQEGFSQMLARKRAGLLTIDALG